MARHGRPMLSIGTAALLFGATLNGVASPGAQHPDTQDPDARSEAVLTRLCAGCHPWRRVLDTRRTRVQWEPVIDEMMRRGGFSSDDDYNAILEYVLRHNAFVNINQAEADEIAMVTGLAPQHAEAILSYRTEHGRFADFEALKKVSGIDLVKLEAARLAILYR